jgi:release factor glutamine methyltransferase
MAFHAVRRTSPSPALAASNGGASEATSSPSPGAPHSRQGAFHAAPAELLSGAELLRWRRGLLARGGRSEDFDWLLDLAGGVGWSDLQKLRLTPEERVPLRGRRSGLEALWHRHRQSGEPLQYLVGVCPWRDLELAVAPGVLIPRQETELLVDLALQGRGSSSPPALWADLGTGSGCLAVALARALPDAEGLAVDRSGAAMRQAAVNLARHGVERRVQLRCGDWWQPLEPWWGCLDLVLSNPPYIPTAVLAGLEPVVRDHEPALALDGGGDGLEAIRRVVVGAPFALAPGGRLLIEHHHDQSSAVITLLREAGLVCMRAHRDLEGVERFAEARRPEGPR